MDDRKVLQVTFAWAQKSFFGHRKGKKQSHFHRAEAEYMAANDAACEAIWFRRILSDVEQKQQAPTTIIFCDNMSTIAMTNNPVFHARSKHIELRHHFIRNLVNDQEIQFEFVNTKEQLVDGFTKRRVRKNLSMFGLRIKIGVLKN